MHPEWLLIWEFPYDYIIEPMHKIYWIYVYCNLILIQNIDDPEAGIFKRKPHVVRHTRSKKVICFQGTFE